jgi:hypothetical protein
MQTILAQAAILAPLLVALLQALKPLLPQPTDPARQDAYVRVAALILGTALSLAVYLFTAAIFNRTGLGDALAAGGIAALGATGLWHGITGVAAVAGTVRVGTLAPTSAPVTPAFAPIVHDPLSPAAPPGAATPPVPPIAG